MPLPRLIAQINKRVFNPRQLNDDRWVVLTHAGRSSGNVYRTPLAGYRADDSYVFVLMYGSESDWVRNVLAAGAAHLEDGDEELDLANPRLIAEDVAWQLIPEGVKPPPKFLNVTEYLQMDIAR